jgi:hypothetical protein
MDSLVNKNDWDFLSSCEGVNERSNGDKIIFKHGKHKVNSRQHND